MTPNDKIVDAEALLAKATSPTIVNANNWIIDFIGPPALFVKANSSKRPSSPTMASGAQPNATFIFRAGGSTMRAAKSSRTIQPNLAPISSPSLYSIELRTRLTTADYRPREVISLLKTMCVPDAHYTVPGSSTRHKGSAAPQEEGQCADQRAHVSLCHRV